MKFQVGDEVEALPGSGVMVRKGVVAFIQVVGDWVGVDFCSNFTGHNFLGHIKTDTGYWIHPPNLKLVDRGNEITGQVKVIGEL